MAENNYNVVKSVAAKSMLMDLLGKQGYKTYAELLDYFDVYLTSDPHCIAAMLPGKAAIFINRGLTIDQVSPLVRHEILHEYFNHMKKSQDFATAHPDKMPIGDTHQLVNIAGDFDISNRGYTDSDKRTVKAIWLNDQILQGLVTELDMPGWETLTFEEMYEKLLEKQKEAEKDLEQLLKRVCQLNPEDIEELEREIDRMREEEQQGQSGSGQQGQKQSGKGSDEEQDGEGDKEEGEGKDGEEETSTPQSSTGSDGKTQPSKKMPKGKTGPSNKTDAQLDKAEQALDDAADKAEQNAEQRKEGTPEERLPTKGEQAQQSELARRVEKIRELLRDVKRMERSYDEVKTNRQKERIARETRDAERERRNPLNRFKLALNRFIANQIEEEEHETYARINPSYEDSEFIVPGRMYTENKHIPVINVYWDVSGSFSPPQKTEGARRAIATLNQYVRNGDIAIKVYYHANTVSDKKDEAGGGNDADELVRHIIATKPDNIIVISDDNIDHPSLSATVPGAAWYLFYDSDAPGFVDKVRGKRETRSFLLTDY